MHIIAIGILLGILTGVSWGIFPIFAKKNGGNPDNWLYGACIGMGICSIFCLAIISFSDAKTLIDLDGLVFGIQFCTGGAWAVTMIAQYSLIHLIGAAKGLSIANGGKTITSSIFAVFFLGTWLYNGEKIFGFLMVCLITFAIVLINWRPPSDIDKKTLTKHNQKKWLFLTILSIAAIGFSQLPSLLGTIKNSDGGWQNPILSPLLQFIPQAIGACVIGILIIFIRAKFIFKDMGVFTNRTSYINIYDGGIYAIGMICYLYSIFFLKKETNALILNNEGIDAGAGATAFALTNFANIVSAIGGIIILHEKFTKKEIIYFIIGSIVLIVAAILLTYTNNFSFLHSLGKTEPIIK